MEKLESDVKNITFKPKLVSKKAKKQTPLCLKENIAC
jgi:hypothetical protein